MRYPQAAPLKIHRRGADKIHAAQQAYRGQQQRAQLRAYAGHREQLRYVRALYHERHGGDYHHDRAESGVDHVRGAGEESRKFAAEQRGVRSLGRRALFDVLVSDPAALHRGGADEVALKQQICRCAHSDEHRAYHREQIAAAERNSRAHGV